MGIALAQTSTSLSDITEAGSLPRFPADSVAAFGNDILAKTQPFFESEKAAVGGTIVGVPQRRELWQIYPTAQANDDAPTFIAVRDMATLQIASTIRLPLSLLRGGSSVARGEWMHTFDGDRRIFFMSSSRRIVVGIDLRTHAISTYPLGPPLVVQASPTAIALTVTNFGLHPGSLGYDPNDDAIVLVYGGPNGFSVADTNTFVYKLNLKRAATEPGATTVRVIRSCNGPHPAVETSQTTYVELLTTKEYYYFVCHRAGAVGTVVRIARAELASPSSTEDIVVGPVFLETAFADEVSQRLFLVTLSGEIWAFDTQTMSFVGVVAAAVAGQNTRSGYGLDPITGRLFFQSNTFGLGVADGRFFPIPQARVRADKKGFGQERITSDPATGRFFVLEGQSSERAKAYTIYDSGPSVQPPPPANPDRSTADVDEKEGETESRYFASGTGYGFRALAARGFVTIPPAPSLGQVAPTAQVINQTANPKCGYSDRELVGGRVAKAEYDPGSTAARAVGLDVDDRTKVDLEHLKRCDITLRSGSQAFDGLWSTEPTAGLLNGPEQENPDRATKDPGRPWQQSGASCSSSAGADSYNVPSVKDNSSTSCPVPGQVLEARATASFEGGMSVGKAETFTTIKRDAAGVVSTVTAEAQDITINLQAMFASQGVNIGSTPLIHIGRITARAVSRSNGRPPKKDMSQHTIKIGGVEVGAESICINNCNIDEVAKRLTQVAGGRAEFRTVSGLDEFLRRGTPRGALTAVQKSVPRQASDQALIGDFTTEVPAFEIVTYNDNEQFGRARQLYQFAGVASAATYNIVTNPFGAGFDDGSGSDEDIEEAFAPDGGMAELLPGITDMPHQTPIASSSGRGGSILERVVNAIGRGIRMFFTNPRQALLLLTAWALLSLPPFLSKRRKLLTAIRSQ